MIEHNDRPSAQMVADLIATGSDIYSPDDFALIYDVVVERLEYGPKVSESDPWEHVAQHFKEVFPAVMRVPQVEAVQSRLLEKQANEPPGDSLTFIAPVVVFGGAALLGAALALAVVAAIVAYCLKDQHPGKGESAEVNC